MPNLFSTRKIWTRQLARVKAGGDPAAAIRAVLRASILKRRPAEMKRLLAASRAGDREIPTDLLGRVAAKYPRDTPVATELAKVHRDAGRIHDALASLAQLPASPVLPTATLKLWSTLARAGHAAAPGLQKALESALNTPARDHAEHCQLWLDTLPHFPLPTTAAHPVSRYVADASATLLDPQEQSLLTHTLTFHPGSESPPLPAADLSSPTAILLVTHTRDTLAAAGPLVAALGAEGHTVRTFSLDCLLRRDRFWAADGFTRPLRKPSLQFLADRRLTSLRLLNRLIRHATLVVVPPGDPAAAFAASLPETIRPRLASTTR